MHDDVERAVTALQSAAQGLNIAIYRTHIHTVINALQAYERQFEQAEKKNQELINETHRWSEAVKKLEAERVAKDWIPTSDPALLPPPRLKVAILYGPEAGEMWEGHIEVGYRVVGTNGNWWWAGYGETAYPEYISHFYYLPTQTPTTDA